MPTGRGFIGLLEAFRNTGGTVPADVVCRLLEESRLENAVSLAKRVYTGEVFGFEWRGRFWIPMFQFDADDFSLRPCVRQVRENLPPLWSGWAVAAWFAAANSGLHGRCPADLINSQLDAVLRAARALHMDNESPCPVRRNEQIGRESSAHT